MSQGNLGGAVLAARRIGCTVDEYQQRREAGEKFCSGHRMWHRVSEFGRNRSRGDGLAASCRAIEAAAESRRAAAETVERQAQRAAAERADLTRGDTAFLEASDRACTGEDPELFFSQAVGAAAAAKQVCGRCPHTAACLRWALAVGDTWAVLGGLDPEERREARAVGAAA